MRKRDQCICSKYILLFIFSIILAKTNAQTSFTNGSTHRLADSLVNTIPKAKYYFIGQAHNNKANVPVEQELLLALNRKYGVRYDVLEYSHSTAMLMNEFLRSGADSVLRMIQPQAPFTFIRTIKKYNDTARTDKRISFYGIDFEGRLNDQHLKNAIDIVLSRTGLPATTMLFKILSKIKNNTDESTGSHLQELKNYLDQNEVISRNQLGAYYVDLLLVANAQYGFSPRRDDAMYANFIRLYKELIKVDTNPLFLSSFGYAHINPGNANVILNRLRNSADSPVRDSISVIGIQYYESAFEGNKKKKWLGNLSFLCRDKALRTLQATGADGIPGLYLLSKSRLALLSCDEDINKLDAVILVCNMDNTQYYIWE
jgi:hypothetical protein